MRRRISSFSSGFTLIELLVVLGITGLILAVVVTAKPRAAAARVNATAQSIAATLQLARARAIASNVDTLVRIDPASNEFGMNNAMRKLPAGMTISVTIADSERAGRSGAIRYFPDGQSSGGEILLTFEGRTARIGINWLTGEPRLIQ